MLERLRIHTSRRLPGVLISLAAFAGLLAPHEAHAGFVWLLSRNASSPNTGGDDSGDARAISSSGRWSIFETQASDLIAGGADTNFDDDVFLWDAAALTLTLVSHAAGSTVDAAAGDSFARAISDDGRWILFGSEAGNLIAGLTDGAASDDAFLYDRDTGTTTLVSHAHDSLTTAVGGTPQGLSGDGRWVVFTSSSTQVVDGTDTNNGSDVFLWDRLDGSIVLVSHTYDSDTTAGNGGSQALFRQPVSGDGGAVVFFSAATDLVDGTDTNGTIDIFVFDRTSGDVSLVSHRYDSLTTAASSLFSAPSQISADGEWLLFASDGTDLVDGQVDSVGSEDAFLYQRTTGSVTLLSHTAGSPVTAADTELSFPEAISADGSWIVFASLGANLITGQTDPDLSADTFLYDRSTGATTLISAAAGSSTATANGNSEPDAISADGRWVLFSSTATDLVSGANDSNGERDLFLYDRLLGTSTLVTHAVGASSTAADGGSSDGNLSGDGKFVAFSSDADDLVAGTFNGEDQIYLWTVPPADETPPTDPTIDSTDPVEDVWSNDDTVEIIFSGAFDELAGSGLDGYSYLFDHSPSTSPDSIVDLAHTTDPHTITSSALADADDWYAHVATCDVDGNCTNTVHAGPFKIDTVPPQAPTSASSPSHDGGPTNDRTIDVQWTAALDNASGIAGYGWTFTPSSGGAACASFAGTATSATSAELTEGTWYVALCSLDAAGNWSSPGVFGPWTIDLTRPRVTSADSVSDAWIDGVSVPEVEVALTRLLIGFDSTMATSGGGSVLDVANWRLVEDGGDGTLETAGCGGLGGDDLEGMVLGVEASTPATLAAVAVGASSGVGSGLYRLIACDSMTDVPGNGLDGGLGGQSGAWSTDFEVVVDPLVDNPNFDADLSSWQVSDPLPSAWSASEADAEGKALSGAALLDPGPGSGTSFWLSQCVELPSGGEALRTGALARIESNVAGTPEVSVELRWSNAPSCASEVGVSVGGRLAGDTGGQFVPAAGALVVPPPGTLSVELVLRVEELTADQSQVELDRIFLAPSGDLLFRDDQESGDLCPWDVVVGGSCPP